MPSVAAEAIRTWAVCAGCFSGTQYNQSKRSRHNVEEGGEASGEADAGTTAALQEWPG